MTAIFLYQLRKSLIRKTLRLDLNVCYSHYSFLIFIIVKQIEENNDDFTDLISI